MDTWQKSRCDTRWGLCWTSRFGWPDQVDDHQNRHICWSWKGIFGHMQCLWKTKATQAHATAHWSKSYHWRLASLRHLWQGIQVKKCIESPQNLISQILQIELQDKRRSSTALEKLCKRESLRYNLKKIWSKMKQGNYSLRRPPKLIIPQIFIEQRWATVIEFISV